MGKSVGESSSGFMEFGRVDERRRVPRPDTAPNRVNDWFEIYQDFWEELPCTGCALHGLWRALTVQGRLPVNNLIPTGTIWL